MEPTVMSLDFDNSTPHQILEHVLEGGSIDRNGIDALTRHLNKDWRIDLHEAEFLFQVNAAIGQRDEEMEGWTEFFCDNIARLVLFDLHTPGELDEAEGNWLADQLEKSGCGNQTEKTMVEHIRDRAQKIEGRFGQP